MDCEIHRLAPLRRQHEFDPGAEHRAGAGHGRSLRPQDVPVQPAHRQPAPTGGTDPAVEAAALAGGVTGTHRRSQSRGRKENLRGEVPRLPPRSTGIAGGRGNRPEPRQQLRAARGQNAVSGSRGAYSEGSQGTSISGRRDQQGRTGGHGRESRNLAGHRQVHGANAVGDLGDRAVPAQRLRAHALPPAPSGPAAAEIPGRESGVRSRKSGLPDDGFRAGRLGVRHQPAREQQHRPRGRAFRHDAAGGAKSRAAGVFEDAIASYSSRRASTGSRRAVFLAGQIPKNKPTPTETTMPMIAAQAGTEAGSDLKTSLLTKEIIHPKMIPARPPRLVSKEASRRNCSRMSPRLAPMALRMPISWVRSVTDTSMMFMTPMPPTSKPMELRTIITRNVMAVIWRKSATI